MALNKTVADWSDYLNHNLANKRAQTSQSVQRENNLFDKTVQKIVEQISKKNPNLTASIL